MSAENGEIVLYSSIFLKYLIYILYILYQQQCKYMEHVACIYETTSLLALFCIALLMSCFFWQSNWVRNEKDLMLKYAVPVYFQWVDFLGPSLRAYGGGWGTAE